MNIDRVAARQIIAELSDRFEIRQALDIADSAADLAQDEVEFIVAVANEVLNGVGDVRNNLDGRAQIIAAPLLSENFLIDTAGRNIVLARRRTTGEPLVMTQVEIGLGPVVGDENLAMLIRRHRARVDIQIGVELAQSHFVSARLQERAKRRRCETLTE